MTLLLHDPINAHSSPARPVCLYQADSLFPALRTLSYCLTTVKEDHGRIFDYYTLTSNTYAESGLSSTFARIQTHLAMISPRQNDT